MIGIDFRVFGEVGRQAKRTEDDDGVRMGLLFQNSYHGAANLRLKTSGEGMDMEFSFAEEMKWDYRRVFIGISTGRGGSGVLGGYGILGAGGAGWQMMRPIRTGTAAARRGRNWIISESP